MYIYVRVSTCVYVYLQAGFNARSIFLVEYSWFRFKIFLHLHCLIYQYNSLINYLLIAGVGKGRKQFLLVPKAWIGIKMQSVLSRIWTRVTTQTRLCLHVCLYIYLSNSSARMRWDSRLSFKMSLTDVNLEFSFSYTGCHTKVKKPSLPCYLPLTGRRIARFIPFSRVLALCEMLTALTWIRTWDSIYMLNADSHCSTSTFCL